MGDQNRTATALIVLGCPQLPVQTSIALWLSHELRLRGVEVTICGTPSARKLVAVADPDSHYRGTMEDLDACIGRLADGEADYDCSVIFVHNDGGLSYAATIASITDGLVVPVIYGDHAAALADSLPFDCRPAVAPATHNPGPLKRAIREVFPWDALNR